MGKILTLILTAALAASMLLTAGCSTSGCTENQNSLPLAGFYSMATKRAVSVSRLSVMGVGAPGDSLLYGPNATVSQIYLPLRSTASTTSFALTFGVNAADSQEETVTDVITFDYESSPWFASEECGAMYRYRITSLSYTTAVIDSVGITDSLITNLDIEKIRIYVKDGQQPGEGDTES